MVQHSRWIDKKVNGTDFIDLFAMSIYVCLGDPFTAAFHNKVRVIFDA